MMKFLVAFTALVAVAVASPLVKPTTTVAAEIEAIIEAINHPSTDPATAALLEQQLEAILGIAHPEPIAVGPAIVEEDSIVGGPIFVDFPLPDGGEVTAIEPSPVAIPSPVIVPSPVVIGPTQPGAPAPLVQIIVNVNQESISPAPVVTPEVSQPEPVIVVDEADNSLDIIDVFPVVEPAVPEPVIIGNPVVSPTPVQVVEVAPEPVIIGTPIIPEPVIIGTPVVVEPVQVVEVAPEPVLVVEVAPEPIQVVEVAPVEVEPIVVGTPIIPEPVVVLPEELN